jgi:hypothetical protein
MMLSRWPCWLSDRARHHFVITELEYVASCRGRQHGSDLVCRALSRQLTMIWYVMWSVQILILGGLVVLDTALLVMTLALYLLIPPLVIGW